MIESDRRLVQGILCVDLYELTMAQVYFHAGIHEQPAQFEHFFRSYPDYGEHQAGYCINAGLEWLVDWMREVRFGQVEITHLRGLRGRAGDPLFTPDFLSWLERNGDFSAITLRAIPEGRVIHPNVPINVVEGPLAMAQILETALLMQLNYPILIATKAARIRQSGQGKVVFEFGTRRAHGWGALSGIRAAMIGGADYTSNTGVSCVLGYPPRGTQAHSMIQAIIANGGTELDAFRTFAEVYPDDCVLLVDTIDTLGSGIPNAIRVFDELRGRGHQPVGIRLDSGDLAYLCIEAAKMLSGAGYPGAKIVLSNELDELVLLQIIAQIKEEAPGAGLVPDEVIDRLVYGVGTRLITSRGDSALDGAYKLVAVKRGETWEPAIKISETRAKSLTPGEKGVWRLYDRRGKAIADVIGLPGEDLRAMERITVRHPTEQAKFRVFRREDIAEIEPLLVEILRDGKPVYEFPSIERIREVRDRDLVRLHAGVRRIINPHRYHVSITDSLWQLKLNVEQAVTSRSKGD